MVKSWKDTQKYAQNYPHIAIYLNIKYPISPRILSPSPFYPQIRVQRVILIQAAARGSGNTWAKGGMEWLVSFFY